MIYIYFIFIAMFKRQIRSAPDFSLQVNVIYMTKINDQGGSVTV